MNLLTHKRIFLILIMACLTLCLFFYDQNNHLVITSFNYNHAALPSSFNQYKIVHLSDLHNKTFGTKQEKILKEIDKLQPDAIVITGDIIDRRRFDLERAMMLVEGALTIAPVYYVSGNHEAWSNQYDHIFSTLTQAGVTILDDTFTTLTVNSESIKLFGLSDPDFLTSNYLDGTDLTQINQQLEIFSNEDGFKILLSHRPELFDLYASYNMNLIFTGHAHGGQIRLPLIGGVIAPDQGLFPTYSSGFYTSFDTTMFVSRGLGNSLFPFRIFNRPEIICITLTSTH